MAYEPNIIAFPPRSFSPPQKGARVRLGANVGPTFRVIAVVAGKAWVRAEADGEDFIVSVTRCRAAPLA